MDADEIRELGHREGQGTWNKRKLRIEYVAQLAEISESLKRIVDVLETIKDENAQAPFRVPGEERKA